MKRSGKCPKCGSTEVVANAKAIDRGEANVQHEMSVATFLRPDALFFKLKQVTTVSAWVCTDCGYIEFYADSPHTIRLSDT